MSTTSHASGTAVEWVTYIDSSRFPKMLPSKLHLLWSEALAAVGDCYSTIMKSKLMVI